MQRKELGVALKACQDKHALLTEKLQGEAQLKAKWTEAVARHREDRWQAEAEARLGPASAEIVRRHATTALQGSCQRLEDLAREVEKIAMSIATHEAVIAAHGVEEDRLRSELADLPEEEACQKAAAEETRGERAEEEARQQAAEEARRKAAAEEARRKQEEQARLRAEEEARRQAAARRAEEELGLRERYEALGPEGSFFFSRAMGF